MTLRELLILFDPLSELFGDSEVTIHCPDGEAGIEQVIVYYAKTDDHEQRAITISTWSRTLQAHADARARKDGAQ